MKTFGKRKKKLKVTFELKEVIEVTFFMVSLPPNNGLIDAFRGR